MGFRNKKYITFFNKILDINNQADPICIDCINTAIELGRKVIKRIFWLP